MRNRGNFPTGGFNRSPGRGNYGRGNRGGWNRGNRGSFGNRGNRRGNWGGRGRFGSPGPQRGPNSRPSPNNGRPNNSRMGGYQSPPGRRQGGYTLQSVGRSPKKN